MLLLMMTNSNSFYSMIYSGFVRSFLCTLLAATFIPSSFGADKVNKIEEAWDLKLLTTVVHEFKIEKMPVPKALAKLFASIFGGKESDDWSSQFQLIDDDGKQVSLDDRLITLDLVNAPAQKIMDYITELAGCHWEIRGWPGGPDLVIESLTRLDDSERLLYSKGIYCSEAGADLLGLKREMSRVETKSLFKRYGVEFDNDEQLAFWNASTGILAVRHRPEAIAYIRTLISLSEKGWSLVKTDQQESPNKK